MLRLYLSRTDYECVLICNECLTAARQRYAYLLIGQVRNEPCNVRVACEHVATIKKTDVATEAKITSENALEVFPRLHDLLSR